MRARIPAYALPRAGSPAAQKAVVDELSSPTYTHCRHAPRERVVQDFVVDMFVFDDFELDEARFELRRAGKALEVQPKVLRLLLYLVAHRERAVPGDELLRELWPETTVGAGSVKRAVLAARQALGDRSESSIRTVRGLGYQFARSVRGSAPAPAGKPSPPSAAAAIGGGSFVGREALMEVLQATLDDALAGKSRCVLLTGAPGIGKTRTAGELLARARARGAHVWLGPSTAAFGAPALWPFMQVFRDALRDRGASELQALMGAGVAEIVQALPDLQHAMPGLPAPAVLGTRSERFRLLDSVTAFLRRAAERHPVVLGFDDLQRADEASLRLLEFVVRQLGRAPILIVGTFRRELLGAGELPQPLAAVARAESSRIIELGGFDRAAIASYVASATGVQLPAFAVDALHEQTAGNPLFVCQLVESWRATDAAVSFKTLAGASQRLDLQGAIARHLEVVPEACRALLCVAAVLGREFSGALLARVLEQALEPVWLLLSQAEATQLIEPCAERGRFRFTHSLICDALYRQLPLAERARVHGAAARALEAQGIGQNYGLLVEVTRHFVEAAPVHDGGLALTYTLRAAEMSMARLAYEDAAGHFECALSLLEYAAPDPRRRMELLFRKGDALARTAELAAARAALFEVVALARELGDAETLFRAARLIAARPEIGKVDEAQLAALRDAQAALSEADPRRVLLQAAQAKSLAYSHKRSERVQLAREALRRGRKLDDLRLKTEVLIRCHEALIGPEHLPERVVIAAEVFQLAQQRGDASALLRAASTQIETCVESGDSDGFESALASMETLAERVREPYFRWLAKAGRGTQALIQGQLRVAEQRANEALALGRTFGDELALHMYYTQLVNVCMLENRFAESEPIAREMTLRHPGVQGWIARVGVIDGLLGRRDAAQRCLNEIMARQLEWLESEPWPLSGLCSIADLCAIVGDVEAAKPLYAALLPYADHQGLTHLASATYGPVARYLGVMAALQGELARAEEHFQRALALAERMRSPTFSSLTAATYGCVLLLAGRADKKARATALLSEALACAQRSQLEGISSFCRSIARQFSVAAPERTTPA
jgi:predicted ATPase/DNA-binding winged helix-turn-helix (wHTH) protein